MVCPHFVRHDVLVASADGSTAAVVPLGVGHHLGSLCFRDVHFVRLQESHRLHLGFVHVRLISTEFERVISEP